MLAMLVMAIKPDVTVEIGVYTGKSAIPLALAHKAIGKGVVVCIDPWSAKASMEGYDPIHMDWWGTVDHEAIYKEFLLNAAHFQVTPFMDIKRARSNDVEPPKHIGLFHCDGQHTVQAVTDVERFAPSVYPGGVVVMDDTDWQNSGKLQVREAVTRLSAMGFIELFKLGTGAVYQRK